MKNSLLILISIFLLSNTYSQTSLKTKKDSEKSHNMGGNLKTSGLKNTKAKVTGHTSNKVTYSHAQPVGTPTFSNVPFVGEPCASAYLDEHLQRTDQAYRRNRMAIENHTQQFVTSRSGGSRGVVYTIPVVFHVMHSGELLGDSTNITTAQIQSAIAALNRDFRRDSTLDGGIANSGPLGVDAEIEFCLAQRDPNGLYTTGVTRHDMSGNQGYLDSGVYHTPALWRSDASMKSMVQWNPAQYLNIWVVNKIRNTRNIYSTGYTGGVIGYATFPGGSASSDGIVILSSATGSDPTGVLNYNLASYTDDGRILTHEVGHYLNLYHTFQSTSSCSPGTPCATTGDRCCDTPPTTVGMGNNCTSPSCPLENKENYMQYQNGACASDFTPNQVSRMRAVLASGGTRHALTQTNNCTAPAPPQTSYSLNLNAIDYTSRYFSSTPFYGYTNPIFPDSNVLIAWTSSFSPPWLHAVCQTFDLSGGYLNSSGSLFDPAVRPYSVNDTITVDSITIRGYYGRPNVSVVDTAIIRIVAGNHGNYKRAFNASTTDSIISVVDDINRDNAGDSAIWTGKIILDSAFKSDSLSYGAHLFRIAPNISMHSFDGLLGVTVEFKPGNSYSQSSDTIFRNQNFINVVYSTPLGTGTSFPLGYTGNRERTSGSFSDDNTKYTAGTSFNYFLPPIAFSTDHQYQLYDVTLKISKDTTTMVVRDTTTLAAVCDSALVDGNWYYTTQTVTDTVFKPSGAIDSLKYTVITINQSTTSSITQTVCNRYVSASGKTYTSTGIYLDTIANASGCDSVITANITVNYSTSGTDVQSACGSFTWIDGKTYTASNNTAKDTLMNAKGCDSIVTLNLTLKNNSGSTFTHTACDSYVWNGVTYTASNNTAKDTLTNSVGCDSIITLNLTINQSKNSTFTHSACGSYTWNGTTYTSSNNTAKDTLTTATGCDSIITLNLTIGTPNTGVHVISACDSYTWNGTTYTANNNTAKDTLTNVGGCDSVVTLNLTIKSSSSSTFTHSACGSYTWNGITYTANNNTAKDTLVNAVGCDSIITLNLTILPAPNLTVTQTLDTLKSNQSGATYQWIDCGNGNTAIAGATNQQYVPANSGSYAVIVTVGTCSDTTNCKTVAKVGMEDIMNSTPFTIYPNPTSGQFAISFEEQQHTAYQVSIRNSLGQIINQFESSSQIQEVDLKEFSNGLYFITISNATESKTVKIVKQ